jgi:hypothetical protein
MTDQKADTNPISAFLRGSQNLESPDVPKAQVLALGQAAVAVLVVFGFNPSDDVKNLILILAATLGASLPVADATVRQARARNADKIADARLKLRQAPRGVTASGARRLLNALDEDLEQAGAPDPKP